MKISIHLTTCDLCGVEEEISERERVTFKEPEGWYHIMVTKEERENHGSMTFLDVCPKCYTEKCEAFVNSLIAQKVTTD